MAGVDNTQCLAHDFGLAGEQAYIKPPMDDGISASFKDTFGFKPFWSEKRKLFISAITEHTPAYNSGLELGGSITSLNNEDTSNFSAGEFCNLLLKLAGNKESYDKHKTLEITVKKRSGELKNITLIK